MFCPECRYEYRQGFAECPDCDVALVHELPPEPEGPDAEPVDFQEVIYTYNPSDIALIRSVFDAEGLTYFFKGEHFGYMFALAAPARLMVSAEQVQRAIDILRNLTLLDAGSA